MIAHGAALGAHTVDHPRDGVPCLGFGEMRLARQCVIPHALDGGRDDGDELC
jgi:hypothetical protein